MNPALQAQLERLGSTLAAHNAQAVELFALPGQAITSPPNPPPTLERYFNPFTPVVWWESAPTSLEETVTSFSERQVARVAADLNPLASRIYSLFNLLGCTLAQRRGYHVNASQVPYFCPAEAICTHLSIPRGSFYRSLKELVVLGLVVGRGHKTTLNGWAVRCDGTLWSVKLLPRKGGRARLRYDDLKAKYRDLEADIKAGTTVWAQMRRSNTAEGEPMTFEFLLAWATPSKWAKPRYFDCRARYGILTRAPARCTLHNQAGATRTRRCGGSSVGAAFSGRRVAQLLPPLGVATSAVVPERT